MKKKSKSNNHKVGSKKNEVTEPTNRIPFDELEDLFNNSVNDTEIQKYTYTFLIKKQKK